MNDLNSLNTAIGTIAQIDPTLIQQYIRTEDLPTYIFEQTGSPAKLLRSKEETAKIQQQMEKLHLKNKLVTKWQIFALTLKMIFHLMNTTLLN